MNKPITVRDRTGNITTRDDGVLLDGDVVHVTQAFMDSRGAGGVMAAGERILGDAWDRAEFAKLGEAEARHAIVKRKLGTAADGKSPAFLDAAWNTLAGSGVGAGAAPAAVPPPLLRLSDAQKAVAALGIEAALRHGAGRFEVADRNLMQDAKAEQHRTLSDGWKTPADRAREAGQRADAARLGGDQRIAALRTMDAAIKDGWRGGAR